MKRYDVNLNSRIQSALTEEAVRALFVSGQVHRATPCRVSGTRVWLDIDECLPLLKYELSGALRIPASSGPAYRADSPAVGASGEKSKTSALRAGWICFGIGAALAWLFPPAFFFYSVAVLMAIIAMSTHQVQKGLILLLSTFLGMGLSGLISMALMMGLFAHAVSPVVQKADQLAADQNRALTSLQHTLQTLPLPIATPRPAATVPTPLTSAPETWTKRALLDEITRIEQDQRRLRQGGRELLTPRLEYLARLRAAYDR